MAKTAGDTARLSMYTIARCGYYERGGAAPAFSGIADMLDELRLWTNGKRAGATCPIGMSDDEMRVMFVELARDTTTGGFLLVLWNEVPSTVGGVAALSETSEVGKGKVDVEVTDTKEGYVPGYPGYFWIVPERNLLGIVRFPGHLSSKSNLERYVRAILGGCTKYCAWKEGDVVGYRPDASADIATGTGPRFKLEPVIDPEPEQYLKDNWEQITRVMTRRTLSIVESDDDDREDRTLLQQTLEALHLYTPQAMKQEFVALYDVRYTPNPRQLQAMFKAAEADPEAEYGFRLPHRTIWLNKTKFRPEIGVTGKLRNGNVFFADSLLESIESQREGILALLPETAAE
jgi:hypothetical protein